MIRLGNLFFKYRDFAIPAGLVLFALIGKPGLLFGSPYWDGWLNVLGIAVAVSGQVLRAFVIGYAYIKRGGVNKTIFADSLVQEGFFAHSRNPLYVGNLLILFGLLLVLNSFWAYVLGVPFFLLIYVSITLAEEDYLRRQFGAQYEDYCRRVNRFLPSLGGLGKTLEGMQFDWKRLIRKEYGSTFSWLLCLLALLSLEGYRYHQGGGVPAAIWTSLILLVPLILAYTTARYLKKSGRLSS